ncbi:MAG: DUF6089 family protein [Prevotellaceae bacterium]|jgi:hypothetical protein|nr:DUF6089 family protein [Prevotellaceae bacterium]
MKNLTIKIFVLCGMFCFLTANVNAQGKWRSGGGGLYDYSKIFAITLGGGANYYFGDIEKESLFSKYAPKQMQYYGQFSFSFSVMDYLTIRPNIIVDKLSGERNLYAFKSFNIEPDLLFEFYPWTVHRDWGGVYIYIGAGCNFGKIDFDYTLAGVDYNRKVNTVMPMIPLGAGVKFNLTDNLQLGLELGYRFALMDNIDHSLDAYPFMHDGTLMKGAGSQWLDGYYTFGLTFGYCWKY